ncbi:MAG: ATP-binding protein [Roseicyclus sp.]
MSDPLALHLKNRLDDIPGALAAVERHLEAAGCDESVRFDIALALDEVLANIVGNAYEPGATGDIAVLLAVTPEAVEAEVSDAGRPFDPLSRPAPDLDAALEARAVGGLGIHFLRETMQHLQYERTDGRNVLRMTRSRRAREGGGAPGPHGTPR